MYYCVAQSPQEAATSQMAHEVKQDGVHSDQQAGKIFHSQLDMCNLVPV